MIISVTAVFCAEHALPSMTKDSLQLNLSEDAAWSAADCESWHLLVLSLRWKLRYQLSCVTAVVLLLWSINQLPKMMWLQAWQQFEGLPFGLRSGIFSRPWCRCHLICVFPILQSRTVRITVM